MCGLETAGNSKLPGMREAPACVCLIRHGTASWDLHEVQGLAGPSGLGCPPLPLAFHRAASLPTAPLHARRTPLPLLRESWARAALLLLVAGSASQWLAPERRARFKHHLVLVGPPLLEQVRLRSHAWRQWHTLVLAARLIDKRGITSPEPDSDVK